MKERAPGLLLVLALACCVPVAARAQPDSSATPRATSAPRRAGEERDRFELGAGVVRGFFDAVGTFGYRRFLGQGPVFENSLMAELSAGANDQLTEGTLAIYILMRPSFSYRESWRLRPLVEFGPSVHTVFQAASLQDLNRTRYKAHVYVKTHAYAGFEALVSTRVGFLVRGRISIPSHRPFDYAQAAIFLR